MFMHPRLAMRGPRVPVRVSLARRGSVAAVVALILLAANGCSTAPKPNPTLLVTNATCAAGPCRTLTVRAFVNAFSVPGQPPWGFEAVGYVHGASTCLRFPPKWRLAVSEAGTSNVSYLVWTPTSPTGIELYAADSAMLVGGGTVAQRDSSAEARWPFNGSGPGIIGNTSEFVPGSAPGWTVTFPTVSASGDSEPQLAPTSTCAPSAG